MSEFDKLPHFKSGPKLLASDLNKLVDAIKALARGDNLAVAAPLMKGTSRGKVTLRTRRKREGGAGISPLLPFQLSPQTDGGGYVYCQVGLVTKLNGSEVVPDYDGEPLTSTTAIGPVSMRKYVGIKWVGTPNVIQTGLDVDGNPVYGWGSGGTVVGTPEIVVTSDPVDDVIVAPELDTATGAVTTDGTYFATLAIYDNGLMDGPQQRYGPVILNLCGGVGSGVGPAFFVIT